MYSLFFKIQFVSIMAFSFFLFSCNNYDNKYFVDEIHSAPNIREYLLSLIDDKNLSIHFPNIENKLMRGTIENFIAMDKDKNIFATFVVTYPVKRLGTRKLSLTFNHQKKLLLWSKDGSVGFNGGLNDLNGDGYVEKIVNYTETKSKGQYFPQRFKIYSFKDGRLTLLLDVIYNLSTDPGDIGFLRLSVQPSKPGLPYEITLASSSNTQKISFICSNNNSVYSAIVDETANWKMVFPPQKSD